MTDPPAWRAAEVTALIVEAWLRASSRDGHPPLGPETVAVLAGIASAAPSVAARCPLLLRAIGPRVAHQVSGQATALAASEAASAAGDGAGWMSPAQAGQVLGITADGVRWLLRRGQLPGHRDERGWRVPASAVIEREAE